MKLQDLIAIDRDVDITGIATDSRKVEKGNLFLCLKGEKRGGHDHVKEALDKGAAFIVTEKKLGISNEILVPDTHRAASALYSSWYGNPQNGLTVIGVTGTNGKTSTVAMLDAIYRSADYKTATLGTLGMTMDGEHEESDNTTPLPEVLYRKLKEARDRGVDRVIMEVSSHALARHRTADIHFATAIYTNLTQDHLDYHKTMQRYAETKQSLFRQCDTGLFNYDDPYSYYASQVSPCATYGYGHKSGCDFRIQGVPKGSLDGISYSVSYQKSFFEICVPVMGSFQIYNSLAAASCAMLDGVDIPIVQDALSRFCGVKGRLETIYNGEFTVVIDYAHTPDALLSVLKVLKSDQDQSHSRLRVLFGCGGDRDRSKRPIMGHIAMLFADDVIITSDNPRSEDRRAIIEDVLSGTDHHSATTLKVIEDRREALQYAIDSSRQGDILLVAGKGHEEYEIDCNGKHSFSERQILLGRLQKNGFLA